VLAVEQGSVHVEADRLASREPLLGLISSASRATWWRRRLRLLVLNSSNACAIFGVMSTKTAVGSFAIRSKGSSISLGLVVFI